MAKKIKKQIKAGGGTVAPNRIEHPNTALARNEIAMAGAILEGNLTLL